MARRHFRFDHPDNERCTAATAPPKATMPETSTSKMVPALNFAHSKTLAPQQKQLAIPQPPQDMRVLATKNVGLL